MRKEEKTFLAYRLGPDDQPYLKLCPYISSFEMYGEIFIVHDKITDNPPEKRLYDVSHKETGTRITSGNNWYRTSKPKAIEQAKEILERHGKEKVYQAIENMKQQVEALKEL